MPGPVAVTLPSMLGALEPFQVSVSSSTAIAPAKPIAIGRRETRRSRVRSMNGIPTRIAIQIVGMMIVANRSRFGLLNTRSNWKRKK